VVAASSTADTLEDAVGKAYEGMKAINFEDMFYRKDIAHRYSFFSIPLKSPKLAKPLQGPLSRRHQLRP